MKRKMLIIANPGERDAENYCEGVNQDVTRISAFHIVQGGAWKSDGNQNADLSGAGKWLSRSVS